MQFFGKYALWIILLKLYALNKYRTCMTDSMYQYTKVWKSLLWVGICMSLHFLHYFRTFQSIGIRWYIQLRSAPKTFKSYTSNFLHSFWQLVSNDVSTFSFVFFSGLATMQWQYANHKAPRIYLELASPSRGGGLGGPSRPNSSIFARTERTKRFNKQLYLNAKSTYDSFIKYALVLYLRCTAGPIGNLRTGAQKSWLRHWIVFIGRVKWSGLAYHS
jgi:hypothetical protein